ncbi:MAG: cytochrome-c oxidase [Neisseria sp.]|uniref:cytochrome-c oxidase n=1 Tax=Neisseria sp. TaxID=192066 RepID=UPI0026DBCAED|nr:cytochrome-c oxidase [Neisseria sp.]MDO4248855.1 cytochrome-c oxidase [Neisseria sp.]
MSLFKKDDIDLSKIKPQPYESFEKAEQKREEEATAVHPPLTERQKEIVREQSGINPVSQTVSDALKDADDVPETEDRFQDKP